MPFCSLFLHLLPSSNINLWKNVDVLVDNPLQCIVKDFHGLQNIILGPGDISLFAVYKVTFQLFLSHCFSVENQCLKRLMTEIKGSFKKGVKLEELLEILPFVEELQQTNTQ